MSNDENDSPSAGRTAPEDAALPTFGTTRRAAQRDLALRDRLQEVLGAAELLDGDTDDATRSAAIATVRNGVRALLDDLGAPATATARPAAAATPAPTAPPVPEPVTARSPTAETGPMRVLVVEDNPVNQMVATRVLKNLGYESTKATNGVEAIEAATDQFDLILMDLHMPLMDGFAATRELRAGAGDGVNATTPIIAVTADVLSGTRQRCAQAGMDDYLSKPFSQAQLAEVVQRWIGKRAGEPDGSDDVDVNLDEDAQMIADFVSEGRELNAQFEAGLLNLDGDADHAVRLLRVMHSLKGNCGYLGFGRIQRLAHGAEDVLSAVADGRVAADAAGPALLGVADAIATLIDLVAQTGGDADAGAGDPVEPTLLRLDRVLEGEDDVAAPVTTGRVRSALAVRVDPALLDAVSARVQEMVVVQNDLLRKAAAESDSELIAEAQHLDMLVDALQHAVAQVRRQPVETVFRGAPRIVRDAAAICNKTARLEMAGGDVEVDRTMLDGLREPIAHLLRNAVDHGLEPPSVRSANHKPPEGVIRLVASRCDDGRVRIDIRDDGAGIDFDRIRTEAVRRGVLDDAAAAAASEADLTDVLFAPRFSTAAEVTEVSGRGVGLDAVREAVRRLDGELQVSSVAGFGTTFALLLPDR